MIQELIKRLDHLKTLVVKKDLTKEERYDIYCEIDDILALIERYNKVINNR